MGATRAGVDILCISHLRWGFVFQRPQHLLSRWARTHRVFYVEEPVESDQIGCDTHETPEGVTLLVPRIPSGLAPDETEAIQRLVLTDALVEHDISRYVLWLYTPMAEHFSAQLDPVATVYDCMDELSAFAGAPADLAHREQRLLERADVVFTGGSSLYEAKRRKHPNVHCFPSSVDAAHFRTARGPLPEPPSQGSVPRPRLGYYGVIDERIDRELIAGLADARPDWQIVLVGPVVKIDPASLPRRDNIHYLGARSYAELPAHAAGWDCAIMPFALNEATRFISPTKTLEYLAAGRPVVSTSIADVVVGYGASGTVRIAADVAGWVAAVDSALREGFTPIAGAVDELLGRTSWDLTFERMRAEVDAVLPRPAALPARGRDHDFLVVGAGFAGSVLAERLASAGKRVLIVDRRPHIGGNAYDHLDEAGVLVHRYGPHIFHTNSRDVFEYLSRFTDWRPYEHRVLASVDGRLVPMPINLDTLEQLYGLELTPETAEAYYRSVAEPREHVRTSEDVVVSRIGRDLYLKFFRNYTRKQWGLDPSELDASVAARVPARIDRDGRYFTDVYQAMPRDGFARMFERMLDHPNITVMVGVDHRQLEDTVRYAEMIYTGPIDEYFGHRFGRLPYRSLEFVFETHDVPVFQPAAVVNYPNEHPYTRVTEFKYLTGQRHPRTTVVYEHPRAEGDPYYPVPRPENAELYKRYKALADATPRVHFVGRLATYKYYNMDQVVAQALAVYRRMELTPSEPVRSWAKVG